MLAPWWETVPGRLEAELNAFRDAGIRFSVREEEKADGLLFLDVSFPSDEGLLELEVAFPDTYPYTRPEVYAPQLRLQHHQNPVSHNLCLIGRRSDEWDPQELALELVQQQIPVVFAANRAMDKADAILIEEHQGEPITAFLTFENNSVCFVDGAWRLPSGPILGKAKFSFSSTEGVLRALVHSVTDCSGQEYAVPSLPFRLSHEYVCRFVQLEKPIITATAADFGRELVRAFPSLGQRQITDGVDLILVGFPEEHEWRSNGQGWILFVRRKPTGTKGSIKNDEPSLVRVQRMGPSDYAVRVPVFSKLRDKKVAVFGAGCIGAPIILELCKAGLGSIAVVDHDIVDGPSTVRWPLGVSAAGRHKVDALRQFIGLNLPHLKSFWGAGHRIGTVATGSQLRDREVLDQALTDADLVIDATAEFGIQRLLSDLALRKGIPYLGVHSTNGAYGGVVFQVIGHRTGCWNCLAWAQADGLIPNPAALEAEWQQPRGCAAPTFVGAAWDLQELSMAATRQAVALLTDAADPSWDVAVVNLRDAAGAACLPMWQTFRLEPHEKCLSCPASR